MQKMLQFSNIDYVEIYTRMIDITIHWKIQFFLDWKNN